MSTTGGREAVRVLGRGLLTGAVGIVGLLCLGYGLSLRFHVENTQEAMAQADIGARWLLVATACLVVAAATARWAGAPWPAALAVALPVVLGVVPAILLPGNIVPVGSALLASVAAVAGLAVVVVVAAR